MRRNRLIFYGLWVLSLVGISFYGGPVSYGFFILLTLIPVVSFSYLLYEFFAFRIFQRLGNWNTISNQITPYYFTLQNESPFGLSGIRVTFFSSFSKISGLSDAEYELQPGTGIELTAELTCYYRGEYEVGIKKIEFQDFFRLFHLTVHNRETLKILVKPRIVELESKAFSPILFATKQTNAANTELDMLVREYVPGDDIRHVHWGLTAVEQKLMVRKQIGEEQSGIGILMDTRRLSEDPMVYLPSENRIMELTLALAMYFVKHGTKATTYYSSGSVNELVVARMEQFTGYYNTMSNLFFQENEGLEKAWTKLQTTGRLLGNKHVFLVLGEWSQAALQVVEYLNEHHISVTIYLVTEEENVELRLPYADVSTISPYGVLEDLL